MIYITANLHESSHDAEAGIELAVLGGQSGNDGVVGALAGREHIGVCGIEREIGSPILERETTCFWNERRSKAHVVAAIGS